MFVGHVGAVSSVCVAMGTGAAVTGSLDASVRAWDLQTGKCTGTMARNMYVADNCHGDEFFE